MKTGLLEGKVEKPTLRGHQRRSDPPSTATGAFSKQLRQISCPTFTFSHKLRLGRLRLSDSLLLPSSLPAPSGSSRCLVPSR